MTEKKKDVNATQGEGAAADINITTLDNPMPTPKADPDITSMDNPMPTGAVKDTLTSMDNPMPAPPSALGLDGGK